MTDPVIKEEIEEENHVDGWQSGPLNTGDWVFKTEEVDISDVETAGSEGKSPPYHLTMEDSANDGDEEFVQKTGPKKAKICAERVAQTDNLATYKKRSGNWSDHEVRLLIHVWKSHVNRLRANKRNGPIYKQMAMELGEMLETPPRGNLEVQNKINNLAREYRREKAKKVSGGSPSSWKFFSGIDNLLGTLPAKYDRQVSESLPSSAPSSASSSASDAHSPTFPEENSLPIGQEAECPPSTSRPTSALRRRRISSTASDEVVQEMLELQRSLAQELQTSNARMLEIMKEDAASQREFQNTLVSLLTQLVNKN